MRDGPLLLDTCALIWFVAGDQRLARAKSKLEKAAQNSNLFICPISIWEICVKVSTQRLRLSMPVMDWIVATKKKSGIQNTVLSDDIMFRSTNLPGNFHKDPADRMIVATAILDSLTLVTGDERILGWAKYNKLNVLAV